MPVRKKWGEKKWGSFKWGGSDVVIGGVDYSECYDFSVEDILTQEANLCSLAVLAKWSDRPRIGMEAIIYFKNDLVFAGRVSSVESEKLFSSPSDREDNLFKFSLEIEDYSFDLKRYLVAYAWDNATMWEIVNDIVNTTSPYSSDTTETLADLGITIDSTQLSAVITGDTYDKIAFNYITPMECFRKLCELVGWDFYIDYEKKLHFFSIDTALASAPINLEDDGNEFWDLYFEPEDASQIRNRVYVRGGKQLSASYEQIAHPPAYDKSLTLDYEAKSSDGGDGIIGITVDGTPATFGYDGITTAGTVDFMVSAKQKNVKIDQYNSSTPPSHFFAGTEEIKITYKYMLPLLVREDDIVSQNAIKALCGGTGIFEHLLTDTEITSQQWARDRAIQELSQYSNPIITGSFSTIRMGFRSGQKILVDLTDRGFTGALPFLIRKVSISAIGAENLQYDIEFSTILRDFNWLLMKLLDYQKSAEKRDDEVVDKLWNVLEEITASESVSTTLAAPPFKWSNDLGTTPNKLRWNLGEWA